MSQSPQLRKQLQCEHCVGDRPEDYSVYLYKAKSHAFLAGHYRTYLKPNRGCQKDQCEFENGIFYIASSRPVRKYNETMYKGENSCLLNFQTKKLPMCI